MTAVREQRAGERKEHRTRHEPPEGDPIESWTALDPDNSPDAPADLSTRLRVLADMHVERALLGGGLLAESAARIAADLDPADWYNPRHRAIAAGIGAVLADGGRPDSLTVADEIRRAGHEIIEIPELNDLYIETPSVSSADRYARIIRRHAKHRRIVALSDQLARAAMDGQEGRLETLAAGIAAEVES